MALPNGFVLENRYRIVRLLGQGGSGAVYRAWDLQLRGPCAIKENLDLSPASRQQFAREATILSGLRHSGLPVIYAHFAVPGQGQYLVMDFIEGDDLQAVIERSAGGVVSVPQAPQKAAHPQPCGASVAQVAAWIAQVCDILTYLHSQTPPVIHHDVKPANLKLTPQGQVVLVDFGIARHFDPNRPVTQAGQMVTPGYSPPEQYAGETLDPRSDIYALGATTYALLTGQAPPAALEVLAGKAAQPTPAHVLNPAVPPGVSTVIQHAMRSRPDERYPSAEAFQGALLAAVSQPRRQTTWRWAALALAAAALLVASLAGWRLNFSATPALPPTQTASSPAATSTATVPSFPAAQVTQTRQPFTPAATPTRVVVPTSTVTQIPYPFTSIGTPIPAPLEAISPDNLDRLVELARWQTGFLQAVDFAPDGQAIALALDLQERSLELRYLPDGKVDQLIDQLAYVDRIEFSPDGSTLTIGFIFKGIVQFFNLRSQQAREVTVPFAASEDRIYSWAFSPDGALLAAGLPGGRIHLWRAADGSLVQALEGHAGIILGLEFSPDRRWLASSASDGRIRLWSIADGRMVREMDERDTSLNLAFSPDGKLVASSNALWNVSDGQKLASLEASSPAFDRERVAFSPNGALLVTVGQSGVIGFYSARDGRFLDSLETEYSRVVDFSPDGRYLLTGGQVSTESGSQGLVHFWGVAP